MNTPSRAPNFFAWLIGVNFIGRPLGWSHAQYAAWLRSEAIEG